MGPAWSPQSCKPTEFQKIKRFKRFSLWKNKTQTALKQDAGPDENRLRNVSDQGKYLAAIIKPPTKISSLKSRFEAAG